MPHLGIRGHRIDKLRESKFTLRSHGTCEMVDDSNDSNVQSYSEKFDQSLHVQPPDVVVPLLVALRGVGILIYPVRERSITEVGNGGVDGVLEWKDVDFRIVAGLAHVYLSSKVAIRSNCVIPMTTGPLIR